LLGWGVGGLLASFGMACALAWHGASRQALADRRALAHLEFALEEFYLDLSRYPDISEGFAALVTPDPDLDGQALAGWRGPYLDLGRGALRWSSRQGGLLDLHGNLILYYASPDGSWVYLAAVGPNGRLDTPGLGSASFDGAVDGDDIVVWLEGP